MNVLKKFVIPNYTLNSKGREEKKNKIGIEYIPGDTNAIKKPKRLKSG
jgi:hypothetical protein